jgi:Fe-S oxidoreductase
MRLLVDSDEAKQVTGSTYELMDYLRPFMEMKPLSLGNPYAKKRIAYHAPCHLKAMHLSGISIDLLEKCGVKITDINGGCCGLAGTAGMQKKHHDLSDAIGSLLADRISESDPDIILTECAACKMQIEHLTGKPVLHPVKLLAQALK